MYIKEISFRSKQGHQLAGVLELPVDRHPVAYAIFAHCFTCNKNFKAVKNISHALTSRGVAVLRFDFTGLGESAGEFSDTNFSSNIADLEAAAAFLANNYSSPSILIGHSLGGAAVIFAASRITSVRAIVTIGAPSDPSHVKHLFKNDIAEILARGEATVDIGGREFTVSSEFLNDIQNKNLCNILRELRIPILIMHSPQDKIVSIDNAADIYGCAFHPKSFISLDGADHLLSSQADSLYTGEIIGAWLQRFVPREIADELETDKQIVAEIQKDSYTTEIKAGIHRMIADEPESIGGNNFGPDPYKFLAAGLGACTAITLRMYANRKNIPLDEVRVHVDHKHDYLEDCEDYDNKQSKIDVFHRFIELEGKLTEKQVNRLLEIADKCPVHKTLESKAKITTELLNSPALLSQENQPNVD